MKSRRRVELAIANLKRFALSSDRESLGLSGWQVAWNLVPFLNELRRDSVHMRELLEAARHLSAGRGPGQGRAEEELLQHLNHIARDCGFYLKRRKMAISDASDLMLAAVRRHWEVLQALAQYAVWCLELRKPRDSFGGRRRVAALKILSQAGDFMEIPEAVRLAGQLQKSNRDDGEEAADFLARYYEARGMEAPHVLGTRTPSCSRP